MDLEFWKLALQVVNFIVVIGIGFYGHLMLKDKVTNERIKKLEDDLDDKLEGQSERIATLEERSLNTPNHADLAKVYESINDLSKTVHKLAGQVDAQGDMLRLILNRITERGMK